MKHYHSQSLLLLIVCPILLFFNPLFKNVDTGDIQKPQRVQRENKKTYWDCYVDGTYTKVSVTEGEIFTAILHTKNFGTLILRGAGDSRSQLFGSIEKKGEPFALGTFLLNKAAPIGELQPNHTLIGEMKINAQNSTHAITLSPME